MKPKVWHVNDQRKPAGTVYVGRPTKWGNPYAIIPGTGFTRLVVLAKYREYINSFPQLQHAAREELRGKHLACWCAPSPCHADILLEIANCRTTT